MTEDSPEQTVRQMPGIFSPNSLEVISLGELAEVGFHPPPQPAQVRAPARLRVVRLVLDR
jgi:hypothetical protein